MALAEGEPGKLRVTVIRSLAAREVDVRHLELPKGSTVADALQRCGWWSDTLRAPDSALGVWGKFQRPEHVLRDLDRVEIYRGLRVDPKEARRERYAAHKAKCAPDAKKRVSR